MNVNTNTQQRMLHKKFTPQMKPYPPTLFPHQMAMLQRGFAYPMKEQFYPPKFLMKSELPIRKAVTVKVPTTPKRSEDNKGVTMVSSPEVKVDFNSIDNICFFPKNAMMMPMNRFEDIPTASTSTESLLSSSTPYKNNLVRSQDSLMPPPFMANPFMCFPMPQMMNSIKPSSYPKRKLSYGGTGVANPKRGMSGLSTAYDSNSSTKKPLKNFYNKFNSPNEQNENTNILEIQCQVGENDVRVFKLKKYDDLFTSLQQFIDMNQIRQELIQPLANKIFACLNKIFWLCNNKVGQYDQKYLLSLYRVWKKNKENLPKANHRHAQSVYSKEPNLPKSETKANSKGNVTGSYSFNFYEELTEDSYEERRKTQ